MEEGENEGKERKAMTRMSGPIHYNTIMMALIEWNRQHKSTVGNLFLFRFVF
jgi:hypothetical protein